MQSMVFPYSYGSHTLYPGKKQVWGTGPYMKKKIFLCRLNYIPIHVVIMVTLVWGTTGVWGGASDWGGIGDSGGVSDWGGAGEWRVTGGSGPHPDY